MGRPLRLLCCFCAVASLGDDLNTCAAPIAEEDHGTDAGRASGTLELRDRHDHGQRSDPHRQPRIVRGVGLERLVGLTQAQDQSVERIAVSDGAVIGRR
jgi:hypothetical protein